MPLSHEDTATLVDEVQTFIERREAEQIAYGVYDVTMTGAEVIAGFRPLSVSIAPDDDREGYVRAALQHLWGRLDILRLDGGQDASPEEWVLRSRIAEMVRLLSKLRQRLPPRYEGERQRQRISHAKRLTGDTRKEQKDRLLT